MVLVEEFEEIWVYFSPKICISNILVIPNIFVILAVLCLTDAEILHNLICLETGSILSIFSFKVSTILTWVNRRRKRFRAKESVETMNVSIWGLIYCFGKSVIKRYFECLKVELIELIYLNIHIYSSLQIFLIADSSEEEWSTKNNE